MTDTIWKKRACAGAVHRDVLCRSTPAKHRRVLLEILGDFPSNDRVAAKITEELQKRGFKVIPYAREGFAADGSMMVDTVEQFKAKYDAALCIGNIENASNRTTGRINWFTFFGPGNNMPWFVHEVPTVFGWTKRWTAITAL